MFSSVCVVYFAGSLLTFVRRVAASGRLMARYCVGFETMKNFHEISGDESLQDLVSGKVFHRS